MGRPKLQTTRDRQFNVGLTASELAALHRAARLAGMRPVDYGRARLLSKPRRMVRTVRTETAVHPVDPLVVIQLARIRTGRPRSWPMTIPGMRMCMS